VYNLHIAISGANPLTVSEYQALEMKMGTHVGVSR
jgi:hypothetical protein